MNAQEILKTWEQSAPNRFVCYVISKEPDNSGMWYGEIFVVENRVHYQYMMYSKTQEELAEALASSVLELYFK